MSKASKSVPKKHSPRVASWIYGVINPLLEIIPIELSFLRKGNATFRFYNMELEFIRTVESYLSPPARHICRDFMNANTDAIQWLSDHDKHINALEIAAQKAFKVLSNKPEFLSKVKNFLEEYLSTGQGYPGGAYPDEKFPLLVAEHVVNKINSLPEHYTDYKFWTQYGKEFLKFYAGHEFNGLDKTREDLLSFDNELIDWLQKKSFQLCEQYDISAAPIPGV